MIDLKPYGAFIENSIRPILEQVNVFLDEVDKRGFRLDKSNLQFLLDYLFKLNVQIMVLKAIVSITVTGMVCFTCLKLLR